MEVNVNVTLEMGAKTLAFLTGIAAASPAALAQDKQPAPAEVQKPAEPAPKTEAAAQAPKAEPEKPASTRSRRTKEQIAADNQATKSGFTDMSDDEKLDAIKAKVTELTKNKKGADVKWILGQFNAASVSKAEPLEADDYDAFFDALTRYADGEVLTDIFPDEDVLG